ncbi:uncharacterized protein METZ01_LOCUS517425, partial [marine metagenome]
MAKCKQDKAVQEMQIHLYGVSDHFDLHQGEYVSIFSQQDHTLALV